ncbi:MAG: hydrogenase maturation nickel metallochaperone HypA [Candidatus Omnitrophota bacterium]
MHEIKLTENMISILEREAADPAVGEVKVVHLAIGKLRYIVPEIICSCFEHIPKSGKLKGARLDISEVPVTIRCASCGSERVVDDGVYACTACECQDIEIMTGREFMVKGIEW